jgi:predicted HTH domain antitoxin
MASRLVIEYPERLPDSLHQSPTEFEAEARLALATKMFEMRRLSSGMAARLAGVNRVEFLLELHRFGVPALDLDEGELESDLHNV